MSFLDSVVDFGKKAAGFVSSDSIGGSLARTALLGFANNRINKMINKDNDSSGRGAQRDAGVREQVNVDPSYSVPVIYGNAYLEGAVTDARITGDNRTMWYCITLCEQTGTKITGEPSEITIQEVYWNDHRLEFRSDGVTVGDAVTADGEVLSNYSGNIRMYPFAGSSNDPVFLATEPTGNTQPAYNLFPKWTNEHTMDGLVFVLIKVNYNASDQVTGLGNVRFRINNTLYQPGDVLFDYMNNPRYGAGIPAGEMNL